MKRIFIVVMVLFMFPQSFAHATEPVSKVESRDWEVTVYKTDFSVDESMSKCNDDCTNFNIVIKNKANEKFNVMTVITYGSERMGYGFTTKGGFFNERQEQIGSNEVLTDFTNYPAAKNRDSLEILLVWKGEKDQGHNKQTLVVPIKHE